MPDWGPSFLQFARAKQRWSFSVSLFQLSLLTPARHHGPVPDAAVGAGGRGSCLRSSYIKRTNERLSGGFFSNGIGSRLIPPAEDSTTHHQAPAGINGADALLYNGRPILELVGVKSRFGGKAKQTTIKGQKQENADQVWFRKTKASIHTCTHALEPRKEEPPTEFKKSND